MRPVPDTDTSTTRPPSSQPLRWTRREQLGVEIHEADSDLWTYAVTQYNGDIELVMVDRRHGRVLSNRAGCESVAQAQELAESLEAHHLSAVVHRNRPAADPARSCLRCGDTLAPSDLQEERNPADPEDYRYHVRCPNRVCGARYVVGADELSSYHAEIEEDA